MRRLARQFLCGKLRKLVICESLFVSTPLYRKYPDGGVHACLRPCVSPLLKAIPWSTGPGSSHATTVLTLKLGLEKAGFRS